jgi:hypothetical protein
MKTFTQEQVIKLLKKRQGNLSLNDFGKQFGVSGQLIGDIYRGRILPGDTLGFGRIVRFFEKEQNGE